MGTTSQISLEEYTSINATTLATFFIQPLKMSEFVWPSIGADQIQVTQHLWDFLYRFFFFSLPPLSRPRKSLFYLLNMRVFLNEKNFKWDIIFGPTKIVASHAQISFELFLPWGGKTQQIPCGFHKEVRDVCIGFSYLCITIGNEKI